MGKLRKLWLSGENFLLPTCRNVLEPLSMAQQLRFRNIGKLLKR